MTKPIIGFVGMTHLGLVSGVSATEKGFQVICFDQDAEKVKALKEDKLSVSEPQLSELLFKNKSQISFTDDVSDLKKCDLIYVASDIATDDSGKSDLVHIDALLNLTFDAVHNDAVIVVLSQVPPGFSRLRVRSGKILYYQVETLIFGRAIERALYPERFIIGCVDPDKDLQSVYKVFLDAHECPILKMRYESAELAKISINMCLVASVTTANTLAEICEKIGADWSEIVPALKLDRRIGQYSYLSAGLGLSGGNLERDLATVNDLAYKYNTDAGIVKAWITNSSQRKTWPIKILEEIFHDKNELVIAVLGIAYKENTDSIKNSPALSIIAHLQYAKLRVYDPVVIWNKEWHSNAIICNSPYMAINNANVVMILTQWKEFSEPNFRDVLLNSKKIIIDPYDLLKSNKKLNPKIYTLGR